MEQLPSLSPTEALFVARARGVLPLEEARMYRSDHGALVFHWDAPCQAVGGLWLTVYDQQEIMLSSRLSHTHVERWRIAIDVTVEGEIWPKLVDQGIAEAHEILNGETVFIKSYDAEGNEQSSSAMWTRRQWMEERVGGGRTNERAWNWFGEVTVS